MSVRCFGFRSQEVEGVMSRAANIRGVGGVGGGVIVAIFALCASACNGEECHTPKPEEEVREEAAEQVEDAMDAMDASDDQRALVKVQVDELVDTTLAQRTERLARQEELVTAVQAEDLEVKALQLQESGLRLLIIRLLSQCSTVPTSA